MATPLRVCHVDPELGFSGGEVQVFLLMEGLCARGHENLVMCQPQSRIEEEARARGFETAAVKMRSDLDFLGARTAKRVLAGSEVDLVHLHTGRATWLGGLAAHWCKKPAITTRRMDRRVKRGWRTRKIYAELVSRAVAISGPVADCLREGGVPEEMIRIIHSSIDPAALVPTKSRTEARRALGLDPDRPVIASLVSLVHRKGIDVLIEALARMQRADALAIVAGDGPERARLEELCAARGVSDRVRFPGRITDKQGLLAAADLYCLPSRAEGLGVSALEAMACGLPVVASRVGGLAEAVVDGECGLLVEPEDADALAAALDTVLEDPDLARRLGEGGRARVAASYTAERMVERYEDLYREVLREA